MTRTWQCEADALEGLEEFVADELVERLRDGVRLTDIATPGRIAFATQGSLGALLELRSALAVYLVLPFDVPRPKALLGHQHFERILEIIAAVRRLHPRDAFRTLRLSAAGEDSGVLLRLKDELAAQTGLAIAPDEADLLLRLRRAPDGWWELLVRISPRPLATRQWRVCNLPGALNATLAHAMVMMTEPSPDDQFLNLACGSGTLLAERLALGRAHEALGCDLDTAALSCAHANLAAAGHAPAVHLERWDATDLPLPDGSADVICADLPFGQLVGTHRENERIYPLMIAEAARVASAGARMVLLTHEVRLLEQVVARHTNEWEHLTTLPVRSGGMMPRIFAFRRR